MKILCLSPHTDDAEVGCGGSIAKFTEEGHTVYLAAFSIAEKSLPKGTPENILTLESRAAAEVFGIVPGNLFIYHYPVREFPKFRQEILEDLVSLNNQIRPDMVLLPSKYDSHQDHGIIAVEGFRAFKYSSILGYEMPGNNIIFEATSFICLEKHHIERKLEALKCYKSQRIRVEQLGRRPLDSESVKGLAQVRGLQLGINYAEAFNMVRWIIK